MNIHSAKGCNTDESRRDDVAQRGGDHKVRLESSRKSMSAG